MSSTNKRKGSTVPVTVSLYPVEIKAVEDLATEQGSNFSQALRDIVNNWIGGVKSGKEKE